MKNSIVKIKYCLVFLLLLLANISFSACVICMSGAGCITLKSSSCAEHRGLMEMAHANGLGWGCADFKVASNLVTNENGTAAIIIDGEKMILGSDKAEMFLLEIIKLQNEKRLTPKIFAVRYKLFKKSDNGKVSIERLKLLSKEFNVKLTHNSV